MAPIQSSLSVVMPYYRNERTLLPCLHSFIQQQAITPIEIIVVDDGEVPTAHAMVAQHRWPVPIRILRSGAKGQSAATNLGIRHAQGQIVLLTCADIIATPSLLRSHVQAHQQGAALGVMGQIAYAPWLDAPPIMQFLAMPRVQFDFANIADSQNVSANMLYAPNVSVAKEHLDQIGGFDEALTYGYQDCDLGLRLAQRGVRFVYRAEALVWHDHPNSVRGYVQRQMRIHQFWAVMAKRYPHIAKLEIMARQLDHYVPRLGQLEQLTLLAEKADARYGVRHALEHQDRQRLFALFDTLGTLAAVKGMVRDVAGLQEVLDVRHRPWYGSLGAPRPVPGLAPESPN